MGRFKRMWQGAKVADVTLSLGDMALRIIGASTVLSGVAGGITWLFAYPYAALVVGLVVWIVVAIAILLGQSMRQANAVTEGATTTQSEGVSSQPASSDTDSRQAEELKRLAAALEEVEQKAAQLQGQVERLTVNNDKLRQKLIRYDGDRAKFKNLLVAAYEEGQKVRKGNPSQRDAEEWKERVGGLLEAAVGDWLVERVLGDDPTFRSARFGTPEQTWMDSRLDRLIDYAKSLETQETVQFRSGFDSHDYDPSTLTPKSGVEERNALKKKVAHWENRRLLRRALSEAYKDGLFWRNGKPSEKSVVKWATRTCGLIRAALEDEAEAKGFMKAGGRYLGDEGSAASKIASNDTKEQLIIDGHLGYLHEVMGRVNSLDPLKLQPDFDGQEWVSKK